MEQSQLLLLPRPRRLELRDGDGAPREASADSGLNRSLGAEAFTLEIGGGRIRIRFGDSNGRRYARETLRQLRHQCPETLPALRIEDAPDFPVRGLMLDVSRDRVPTQETLERLVHLMARLRLNHLELYTEHTFAYTRPRGRCGATPLPLTSRRRAAGWTPSATRARRGARRPTRTPSATWGAGFGTSAYRAPAPRRRTAGRPKLRCAHARRWLSSRLPRTTPVFELVRGLLRELLPCFTSRRVNIGCDETFELGQVAVAAARRGAATAAGACTSIFLLRLIGAPARGRAARRCSGATSCGTTPSWCPSCRSHDTVALRLALRSASAESGAAARPRCSSCFAEFGVDREDIPAGVRRRRSPPSPSSEPPLLGVPRHFELEHTRSVAWPNARANLLDAARNCGLARARGSAAT